MMKDLFSGSLGKLNNHGGSKIYTTPNTILVPPEYEIDIGAHGDFVSCSLDGRLWLFANKIIALKWNEETGKMEFSTSRSFNNDAFIQRGIDWILTSRYMIQYNEGRILVEAHKIKDLQPMEKFYSLLPALDGFQIIKGYLIRKPGAEKDNLVYPIENTGIFLIPKGSEIWGKTSESVGQVTILNYGNQYKIKIISTYTANESVTGIAFVGYKLYGFQIDENNKGLCCASQNLNLYDFTYGEWETLSEGTGKIYFDVFNQEAIALYDKGMELLLAKKKVECKALEQWIAPNKELYYVSKENIVSVFPNKVLTTNLICKYYRSLLKTDKELPLTATAYKKNEDENLRLAIGNIDNKLNFNSLNINLFNELDVDDFEIELLNVFEHDYLWCNEENSIFISDDTVYLHVTGWIQKSWHCRDTGVDGPDEVGLDVKENADWWWEGHYYNTIMTDDEFDELRDRLSNVTDIHSSPEGPVIGKWEIDGLTGHQLKYKVNYFYITNTGQYIDNTATFPANSSIKVTINSNFKLIDYDKYIEENYRRSDYVGYVFVSIYKDSETYKIRLYYIFKDTEIVKEYTPSEKYQKLILNSNYDEEFDFYNTNKNNEFIHVVYFKLEDGERWDKPDKGLFFVFRSKLKTRSKL